MKPLQHTKTIALTVALASLLGSVAMAAGLPEKAKAVKNASPKTVKGKMAKQLVDYSSISAYCEFKKANPELTKPHELNDEEKAKFFEWLSNDLKKDGMIVDFSSVVGQLKATEVPDLFVCEKPYEFIDQLLDEADLVDASTFSEEDEEVLTMLEDKAFAEAFSELLDDYHNPQLPDKQ